MTTDNKTPFVFCDESSIRLMFDQRITVGVLGRFVEVQLRAGDGPTEITARIRDALRDEEIVT